MAYVKYTKGVCRVIKSTIEILSKGIIIEYNRLQCNNPTDSNKTICDHHAEMLYIREYHIKNEKAKLKRKEKKNETK